MKNFNTNHDGENSTLRKYRWKPVFLFLLALIFAGNLKAQGGCSDLTPSFINYEPCKYRVQIVNTSDCFTPSITVFIDANAFETWSANTAGGWTGQELAPNMVQLTHSNPFMPIGTSFPMIFTLPVGITTLGNFNWEYTCFPGESCTIFPGIELTSCPDPQDASIIGVKYRECGNLPYSNQPTISGWPIQLLDADGNIIEEQLTGADGSYAFYDRPVGIYTVKEGGRMGWTPKVPASGQYTVDLAPSQQVVRNFGNCPECSCDNIYMDVVQLPISSDTCSYILNLSNNDAYCFNEIDLKVAVGDFASVTPATGWTATMVTAKHYKLTYPPNYIPAQSFQSTFFKVTGAVQHDITVSTSWNNNGVLVTCSRPFSYKCPPPVSPQPCCPMGSTFGPDLVKNSDFSLGNQDFTNNYNYFAPGGPTAIGSYSVLDYGQVYTANNQWACIDHTTYTTAGPMLIVDGYNGPIAWEQQVNVTAGTTYAFSAWFNNLVIPTKNYDDPQMALWVNGSPISSTPILMENPDEWKWLCAQYTAAQTGLVTLQIRMLSTTSVGNDVAIDDISFKECIPPPLCVCPPNAFSNMSYRPNSGPNVPIDCGQIAFWQCNFPVFNLSGDFMCQGNGCPPMPSLSWVLSHPTLGVVNQGPATSPNFTISIPNSSFPVAGLYTLTLIGICDLDTCYCEIIIETPGCGGNDCIEDFDTGSLGQWQSISGQISIITDPITGSQVLKGNDNQGASWMYNNSSDYNGDWTQKFNNCLCFNIRYDSGDPANSPTGIAPLTIYQGSSPLNFTKRATFVVNLPGIGNSWTRVCVPVGLSNGTAYPSNQYGQWTSTSFADFDMVMQGVSGIGIPLDFGNPAVSPSEMVFVDSICIEKCPSPCECKEPSTVTYNTAGTSVTIPCTPGPNFPVFFCPTGPVNISGDFGCVDANGNPCPAPPYPPIDWILYGPNGIIQQGAIITGSPWSLPFTAADLHGSGFFTLYMTTLCPGQVDSCKCVATWFQECIDTCECGPNPWANEFRFGGAMNVPVACGDTISSFTTGSAFFPNFQCQGPPGCGRVDWTLTGPTGYTTQSMIGVIPSLTGVFAIPPVQPTNFTIPGTYTLQMIGICGQDTCPCTVYFCLPPPPPNVDDASICRTLQSVYIPLQGCPTDCDIAEVQWFVKPGSASSWPPLPYQISSAGNPQNCDDLLFLPYQYPTEANVQVYAIIKLDPGCCVSDLTSNIATITLCNPISCSINNPNTLGFCQTGQPLPLTGVLGGANCNYTVEWYNDAGQLVSNALTYTPPVLTFPSNSTACYKDFTFTMKVIGICGTSSCSTTIRVYNSNADNGDLVMDPLEPPHPLPLCPGEDARLTYLDKCSGPPPKWQWYSSTVSGSSGFAPLFGTGMMNSIYYTNQLYQTTWYMVESQNGVCPPQQDKLKIEVKDAISIVSFTAVPDPCVEQQVVLTVGFTPSPITGANCLYVIDWYYNGNLIHTSNSTSSTVSYTYLGPDIPGVYYAVVRDNCCPASVQTWPEIINPPCKPTILGPCYKCDMTTPATLMGEMVLPPQDACPSNIICTYQWYVLDVLPHPDVWVLLPGETGATLTILKGGHYKLETTCDYGYGPCVQEAFHDVAQCMGCMYVGEEEIPLPVELKVDIQPNPTAGNVTVQINPIPLRKGRVEIVDLNGKVLVSNKIPEAQSSVMLSLGHLSNGLYFVRIFESDVLIWTGKVVHSE